MKNKQRFIRNIYRVFIIRPDGYKSQVWMREPKDNEEQDMIPASLIRDILGADSPVPDPDPEIQKILARRVAKRDAPSQPAKNAVFELFLPLAMKSVELKMAFISIALIIGMGIIPTGNFSDGRKFSPVFLSDTLGDSSVYYCTPSLHDTAYKADFK